MDLKIENVTIIGGNGTIGVGVSGIFASFANAKVYVVARTMEKAQKACLDAALSVKALGIIDNLIPKTYDEIEDCIQKSQMIFEAVREDIEIKNSIHKLINQYASENTIILTGTSGLSINLLKTNYDTNKRKNFLGMHFFNPPYSMTLCELIPSSDNKDNSQFLNSLKDYLEKVLLRDVIIVNDTEAFVANRIGFKFLNEALLYAIKYQDKGGISYIDAILGCFTGRNMPPIKTIDFVGLDVHKAIVDNVYQSSNDKSFILPEFVNQLIKENKLGLKVGIGLYKDNLVYDVKSHEYIEIAKYRFPFKDDAIKEFRNANYMEGFNIIKNSDSEEALICMTFLLNYLLDAISVCKKYASNIIDCDVAMAQGFNWIPPLSLIEVLGGRDEVINLCKKYLGCNNNYLEILEDIPKSNYSYNRFIKALE